MPQSWPTGSAFPIWWGNWFSCLDDCMKATIQACLAPQSFSSGSFWALDLTWSLFPPPPPPPVPTCPLPEGLITGSRGPMQWAKQSSAQDITGQCTLLSLCPCLRGQEIPFPKCYIFSGFVTDHLSTLSSRFLWRWTPFPCQWRAY